MSGLCEKYQDLMCAMPDEELSDEEREALRAHLRTCADCRRMYAALGLLSRELSGDLVEPPARLSDGVMERIYAEEEAAEPVDLRRTGRRRTARRRWVPLAAAACLVIIAGGTYLSLGLLAPKGAAGAARQESVTLEAPAMDAAPAAAEAPAAGTLPVPAPAEDETPAEAEAAEAEMDLAAMESAKEVPMAETAQANGEAALNAVFDGGADAADIARPVYTVEAPAAVPAGREADFEALLRADARDGQFPAEALHTLAAVEYRGIIYEFLTDDDETVLLWRDAAESAFPVACAGTPAELWDILE